MLFETYKDAEYTTVLIRLSDKCSSNCYFCELPYLKSNNYGDFNKLDNILSFCSQKMSSNYIIGFLGYNLLDLAIFPDLLKKISKYSNFKYSFQIGLEDIFNNLELIVKNSNTSNLVFGVQKIIRDKKDVLSILNIINIILANDVKLNISFILDFKNNIELIKLLQSKYKNRYIENNIIFEIGKSYIEFEKNIGVESIQDFSYNNCVARNNFHFFDKSIIIKDDIEIDLEGNIKFHLNNFCNQGIKKISSIYKDDEEIYNDFITLKSILLSKNIDRNMCISCIKTPIFI